MLSIAAMSVQRNMQADWQASRDGAPALVAGRSLRCPMADGSSGAGHLTDSDYELDVNSGDIPDDGSPREEVFTPNGTPQPRGPPLPRAVQAERPASHAVTMAVQAALQNFGVNLQRAVTLFEVNYGQLEGARIRISALEGPLEGHPNVLHFEDDAVPTEDEREATGRTAADTSRSTDGRAENHTEDTTGPVYGSWGPGLSTTATSTSSTDHAVAVAPHTPPRFTGGGAAAKPKTNRKSGPHLIARLLSVVVQPHARFSYDPPSCASTVSGVAAVEHRTARAQASAMHLFLTLLTPSPEKIAAELVSVLGDATATFLSMSWTARYITWSALPTSAHSLPSLLQAALRICMYFFVGLCSALRLGAILDSNHFMQAGSSSISGDNNKTAWAILCTRLQQASQL